MGSSQLDKIFSVHFGLISFPYTEMATTQLMAAGFNSRCMLLLLFVQLLFVQLCSAQYCEYEGSPYFEHLYPLYQALEDALISNQEALYMLKQVFFPGVPTPIREANVLQFGPCVEFNITEQLNFTTTDQQPFPNDSVSLEGSRLYRYCFSLRWTTSPLLNLITVDQLLVLDNVFGDLIYSTIAGGTKYNAIMFTLRVPSFPCIPTEEDSLEALSMLLCWVCMLY